VDDSVSSVTGSNEPTVGYGKPNIDADRDSSTC
jgi:hypothetical protein